MYVLKNKSDKQLYRRLHWVAGQILSTSDPDTLEDLHDQREDIQAELGRRAIEAAHALLARIKTPTTPTD